MISDQRSTFFDSLAERIRFRITYAFGLFMGGFIRFEANVSGHHHSGNRTTTLFRIAHHARRTFQAVGNVNIRAANRRFA